ncbi:hypothetical protein [Providencia stuartii]|uniref:hypothetical protein n=1 Tax=Providencia stuartii TaxID=588 RepID=UPI002FD907D0
MTAILSHRSQEGRIDRLDATRGIAILGILLMNIFGFALPQMAYINPVYSQSISQTDMAIWVVFNLFIQGKFLTIFSILFGATLALLRRKGDRWNMSRLVILAVLGLIHGIGFWSGDILFAYAVTGCIALLIFKQYDPGNLLKIAGFVYFIGLVSLLLLGSTVGSSDFWVVSEEQALYESLGNTAGGSVSLIYRTQSMLKPWWKCCLFSMGGSCWG